MRKLLLFLIFGATLHAQTTVNGTCSIVIPPTASSAVTYANGILTVNGVQVNLLSLTQLNLTGGTPLPDGPLQAIGNAGALTFIAAPTGGTATGITGKLVTVAVPKQTGGWTVIYTLVPGLTVAASKPYSLTATPVFSGAPVPATMNPLTPYFYVNTAGQVYLRVDSNVATPYVGGNWTVSMIQ